MSGALRVHVRSPVVSRFVSRRRGSARVRQFESAATTTAAVTGGGACAGRSRRARRFRLERLVVHRAARGRTPRVGRASRVSRARSPRHAPPPRCASSIQASGSPGAEGVVAAAPHRRCPSRRAPRRERSSSSFSVREPPSSPLGTERKRRIGSLRARGPIGLARRRVESLGSRRARRRSRLARRRGRRARPASARDFRPPARARWRARRAARPAEQGAIDLARRAGPAGARLHEAGRPRRRRAADDPELVDLPGCGGSEDDGDDGPPVGERSGSATARPLWPGCGRERHEPRARAGRGAPAPRAAARRRPRARLSSARTRSRSASAAESASARACARLVLDVDGPRIALELQAARAARPPPRRPPSPPDPRARRERGLPRLDPRRDARSRRRGSGFTSGRTLGELGRGRARPPSTASMQPLVRSLATRGAAPPRRAPRGSSAPSA